MLHLVQLAEPDPAGYTDGTVLIFDFAPNMCLVLVEHARNIIHVLDSDKSRDLGLQCIQQAIKTWLHGQAAIEQSSK